MNESFDRYDILQPLGAGGMGEVYLARVTGAHGFEKSVAVKRISSTHGTEAQLISEAKLAVSLAHAKIVQVLDLAHAGDGLYLVMEYVAGTDLAKVCSQLRSGALQPLSVPLVLYLATEALKGLSYAHERADLASGGIIHCDVSPANLLVSYSGGVKLTDFGVARVLAAGRSTGRSVAGKPAYMAPEQARGEPLDARADLYALGVTLYELLAGRRPFELMTFADAGQPRAPLEPLSQMRPGVPAALGQLIERALAFNRQDRPASARAMLGEVAAIARMLDPVTEPDVGAWVAKVVPPQVRAGVAFEGALADILGQPARGNTASAVRTFVARKGAANETTWLEVRQATAPQKQATRWWMWALAGAVIAVSGGTLWSRSMKSPVAAVPQPPPAPVVVMQTPPPQLPSPSVPAEPSPVRPSPVARTAKKPARVGYLNAFAEPWANVFIDGKKVGTTPLHALPVSAGTHRVRFEHPDSPPLERALSVTSGQTELLDVDLVPRSAR